MTPAAPTQADTAAAPLSGWKRYLFVAGDAPAGQHPQDKAGIAAALADTEFAIRAEEATNSLFTRWRILHILLGCLIFALLALHVGAALYYGLRWL